MISLGIGVETPVRLVHASYNGEKDDMAIEDLGCEYEILKSDTYVQVYTGLYRYDIWK